MKELAVRTVFITRGAGGSGAWHGPGRENKMKIASPKSTLIVRGAADFLETKGYTQSPFLWIWRAASTDDLLRASWSPMEM